jgi:hypothetical protein
LLNHKLAGVKWGEFKIGELFEIGTGSLLSNNELKIGMIPRISAKSDNNGILGYFDTTNIEHARHFQNFITVNFFGSDGGIFFHPYIASVEMKVHTLKINHVDMNKKSGNFIACALKPALKGFGYGTQLSSSKLRNSNFKIQLPIKDSQIDFEFIESFISDLRKIYIDDLEDYLNLNDFKDCDLTSEEKEALKDFENLKFEDFNIIDIFNIKNTSNILSRDIIQDSGIIPYLCASSENNGVSSYISYDLKYLEEGGCIFIGGKTFVVTYQEKDFFSNDSHNLTLKLKQNSYRDKLNYLFIATCIKKSLGYKYSWGDSISHKKIQKDKISLPVINQQIDYNFMRNFIGAIQKMIVKDILVYINNLKNDNW